MFLPAIQQLPSVSIPLSEQPSSLLAKVKQIAKTSLLELSLSLAITTSVHIFIGAASAAPLISALAVHFATTIFFRIAGTFAFHKMGENVFTHFCQAICGGSFTFQLGMNGQALIHETGHALAACCVSSARPHIELFPFAGGRTIYSLNPKTAFGTWLGASRCNFLVVASGPAFALFISSALFALGCISRKTHPELSKYLQIWALADYFTHITYALHALSEKVPSKIHDFSYLSLFGIHPIAAAVSIAALPILIFKASP